MFSTSAVGSDAGVEQDPVHPAGGQLDLDKSGEAVFGSRDVDGRPVFGQRRAQRREAFAGGSVGRSGVDREGVADVVDE